MPVCKAGMRSFARPQPLLLESRYTLFLFARHRFPLSKVGLVYEKSVRAVEKSVAAFSQLVTGLCNSIFAVPKSIAALPTLAALVEKLAVAFPNLVAGLCNSVFALPKSIAALPKLVAPCREVGCRFPKVASRFSGPAWLSRVVPIADTRSGGTAFQRFADAPEQADITR